MNNNDNSQNFLFENAPVRGEFVRLKDSFQTIMQQHRYPPVICQILGEMLVVVSLLAASIKFKGKITVQVQGKDRLKFLLAQCMATSPAIEIRGLAQWQGGDIQASELAEQMKYGVLGIILDSSESGGGRYEGRVAWQGDSLAHSIEGYFQQSEQLPTRIWLAINEHQAAGLLLQVMPDAMQHFSENQSWEHLTCLANTITSDELLTLDNVTLLHKLFHEEDVRLFSPTPIRFGCTCSTERSEAALRLIGKEEAEQEIKDKQVLDVTCEFCNKEYLFDRADVERIFKQGPSDASSQVH